MKCKDHLGNEFNSQVEMCKHYGIGVHAFRARLKRGDSLERALTENYRKREECVDHLGQVFKSQREMCRYWGVGVVTFIQRQQRGLSLEACLQSEKIVTVTGKICTDHLGNEFESISAMCREYGVNQATYRKRIESGYSVKDALLGTIIGSKKSCRDHLGNEFESIKAMCKYYGITEGKFSSRRAKGWSLEDCLTLELERRKSCEDHLGNKFASVTEMLKFHGISEAAFNGRRRRGLSLEECLKPADRCFISSECEDHLGNKFTSCVEMCRYWGVDQTTYVGRRNKGYSLKQSLTGEDISYGRGKICVDHTGGKFKTEKEMAEHWGTSYANYKQRLKSGHTLEECLTGKNIGVNIPCEDHLGNKFDSLKEMCKHYGRLEVVYLARIKRGWSIKDALTVDAKPTSVVSVDHLGAEYPSITSMCSAWNVNPDVFYARRKSGWDLESALTGKGIHKKRKVKNEVKDHTGREFSSLTKMCKAWGISLDLYQYYKSQGYSVKSILTGECITPVTVKNHTGAVRDYKGKEYSSMSEMLSYYGISCEEFSARLRLGYSLKEALTNKLDSVGGLVAFIDHNGNQYVSLSSMCKAWNITVELFKKRYEYGYSLRASLTGEGVKDEFK